MNWAGQRERGSAVLARAALWLALHGGRLAGPALVLPATTWFLATSGPARAASRDYLRRVLGRPVRLADVARHFHTFACAVLDRVFLLSGRLDGYRIETVGLDEVLAVLARGQGCILLGAHLGSFEVLRAVAREAPVPVWALMYRRNAGALTALLDRLAPGMRDQVLEIGDMASMIRARECVERGEIVGILADRAPAGHRMVEVPFLGQDAAFPTGPFVLASTLAAPVILFHGLRTGPRRYQVRFEPFAERIALRRATRAADLQEYVQRYATALERACRAHPFNWFNFFPFWTSDAPARRRAALLLVMLCSSPAAAEPDLSLPDLMARLAAVPERQAVFQEHRRLAALSEPLESRGRLIYRRPDHVEKITTWPEPERLVVDGARLVLTPANDAPRVVDLAGQPELRVLIDAIRGPLAGDLPALQRAFTVGLSGTLAAWTIDLAPRDPRAARLLRGAHIRGTGAEVREVRVVQANGDEQVMLIGPAP